MIINYFGLTTFRIQDNSTAVLIDPPLDVSVLKLPKMQNDLVLSSRYDKIKTDKAFLIDSPGEFEVKNIFIYGTEADGPANQPINVYLLEIGGIKLAHLSDINQSKLTAEQLEIFQGVDVLFLPVGNGESLNAVKAREMINQLEPRIVIPMNYDLPTLKKIKLDKLEVFKKEIGANFETVDKLKLTDKDLPEEDTRFIEIKVG